MFCDDSPWWRTYDDDDERSEGDREAHFWRSADNTRTTRESATKWRGVARRGIRSPSSGASPPGSTNRRSSLGPFSRVPRVRRSAVPLFLLRRKKVFGCHLDSSSPSLSLYLFASSFTNLYRRCGALLLARGVARADDWVSCVKSLIKD